MSEMQSSDAFGAIIETLLEGEVICQFTSESLFQYLEGEGRHQDADQFLRRMGRVLLKTNDGCGYYAAYKDIDDSSIKQKIRSKYSKYINEFEPLIRWLHIVLITQNRIRPLLPGDVLKVGELLSAITDAPALVEEMETLANSSLFRSSATGSTKQLDAILKKLQDHRYLAPRGSTGTTYVATAKWSRLYEVMEYILAHEEIDDNQEVMPEQGDILQ